MEYARSCRSLRPDAGEGLPRCVDEYRLARSVPRAGAAMALADAAPRAAAAALRGRRRRPLPAHDRRCRRSPTPTAVTLHDVQHRDLPGLFSRGERLFRRSHDEGSARKADAVIVPSEFVREPRGRALGLAPERVHVIPHGRRARAIPPGRRAARAVPPLPGPALAAQEPRAAARGVRAAPRRSGRSSPSCSRAAATRAARARRASRCAGSSPARSWSTSTAARPASSSRACTRDSASRRSRRWPAAPRSPPRQPASPRCAATPPCSSSPPSPRRSRPSSRARSTRPSASPRRASERARVFTWEETRAPARGRLPLARRHVVAHGAHRPSSSGSACSTFAPPLSRAPHGPPR